MCHVNDHNKIAQRDRVNHTDCLLSRSSRLLGRSIVLLRNSAISKKRQCGLCLPLFHSNVNRIKGQAGRLLEPEEVEKLEKSGYVATPNATDGAAVKARPEQASGEVRKAGTLAAEHDERDMNEEARRFEEEMAKMEAEGAGEVRGRGVQMEEVEDDGM